MAVQYIRYIVGNGRAVFIWYDNWHDFGPLKARFGERIIYDAASREDAKMADYLCDVGWNKPLPVSAALRSITDAWPQYQPKLHEEDSVEWVLTANKVYTLKSAWNAIRDVGRQVDWYRALWHKDAIPRCSFILWLVCKDRLQTRDRLKRKGVIVDSGCVLCGATEETRDHLFCDCNFTKEVCHRALKRNQQNYRCRGWQQELETAIRLYRGASMAATLGRLAMAVTVYCLWQE